MINVAIVGFAPQDTNNIILFYYLLLQASEASHPQWRMQEFRKGVPLIQDCIAV